MKLASARMALSHHLQTTRRWCVSLLVAIAAATALATGASAEVVSRQDVQGRAITFDVQAQLNGDEIDIVGSTDIVFADYGIPQPDTGGVTTQNHGLLEFSLVLTKSA